MPEFYRNGGRLDIVQGGFYERIKVEKKVTDEVDGERPALSSVGIFHGERVMTETRSKV
jgi:hypothetical protein